MVGTSLRFDVDAAAVLVALSRFRSGVDDQEPAWDAVGTSGVDAARAAAPKASGALAASIQSRPTGAGVEITAGSSTVVYAGVQNYGWPARNIAAQRYLDDARDALERDALTELQDGIRSLAGRVGLT